MQVIEDDVIFQPVLGSWPLELPAPTDEALEFAVGDGTIKVRPALGHVQTARWQGNACSSFTAGGRGHFFTL